MSWRKQYNKWLSFDNLDEELKEQLKKMNEEELEDAFYKDLEFGTGGMRDEIVLGLTV